MYSIQEIERLTGCSKRTLRYYESLNLIEPKRKPNGYRYYTQEHIDQIQEILFLKAFHFDLNQIKETLLHPSHDRLSIYKRHMLQLEKEQIKINQLIQNLKNTIASIERNKPMKNQEKFEGFKEKLIEDNDNLYRNEVIQTYGKEAYEKSRKAFSHMSEEMYLKMVKHEQDMFKSLEVASRSTGLDKEKALLDAATSHQAWITMAWGRFDQEAHIGVVKMYQQDERFKSYYDRVKPGFAQLLMEAIILLYQL